MKSFRRIISVLATMMVVLVSARAQQGPTGSASALPKSPVAIFRELLAMSPPDRAAAIAIRPPDIQKRILEKLNEYQLLPNELREQRLRETELRWYLRPLMDEPRTNRPAALAKIPDELREELASRLKLWDLLPEPLQQQLKDNDLIASYFIATPEQRQDVLNQLSPERRDTLETGLARWQKMSEVDRRKAVASFNRYFELTAEQKDKMLNVLSEDDRREMEQTLASYGNLTPQQRSQCIRSFEKFARMSPAERQQFLINAERWHEMTPEERQRWRQLVTVAPIMPLPAVPSQPAWTNRTLLRDRSAIAAN